MIQTIGSRLKNLLADREITNYALSKMTGISESAIGRITKDLTNPSDATLTIISDKLGVNFDWLKNGTGPMRRSNKDLVEELNTVSGNAIVMDRIWQLMDHFNIPTNTMANIIGVSAITFYQMKKKGSPVSETQLRALIANFPSINPNWLIMGEGEMIKSQEIEKTASAIMDLGSAESGLESLQKDLHFKQFVDTYERIKDKIFAEDQEDTTKPRRLNLTHIQTEDSTEFLQLGDDRYMVICPLVDGT